MSVSVINYTIMNVKNNIIYIYLFISLSSFSQISHIDCAILKDSLYQIDEVSYVSRFSPNWVKLTLLNGKWGYHNKETFYAYNTCLNRYVKYAPILYNTEKNRYLGAYTTPTNEPSLKNLTLIDFIFCKKYIYVSLVFDKYNATQVQSLPTQKDRKLYVVASIDYTEGYFYKNKLNFVHIIDTSSQKLPALDTYKRKKKLISKEDFQKVIADEYPEFNKDNAWILSSIYLDTRVTSKGKWSPHEFVVEFFSDYTIQQPDNTYKTGPRFTYDCKKKKIISEFKW